MTPPTFEINGFITGKDVADVADDGDEAVSKQWRVSGPAWTGLRLTDGSGGFDDAFVAPRVLGAACQLEDADLSAGLIVSSDHRVFDGTGYTEGWGTAGARTTGGPGGDRGAAVRGRGALLRGRPRQRRKGDTAADAEGGRGLQHPRAAGHGGLRGLDRGPCPDHGRRGTAHAHPGRPGARTPGSTWSRSRWSPSAPRPPHRHRSRPTASWPATGRASTCGPVRSPPRRPGRRRRGT